MRIHKNPQSSDKPRTMYITARNAKFAPFLKFKVGSTIFYNNVHCLVLPLYHDKFPPQKRQTEKRGKGIKDFLIKITSYYLSE